MDAQQDLVWINSTDSPLPKDPATRTKIKKQAIKKAASSWRRARNQEGYKNRRQYPVIYLTDTPTAPEKQRQSEPKQDLQTQALAEIAKVLNNIPARLTICDYLSLCNKHGLDPLALAFLTSTEMNRISASFIAKNTKFQFPFGQKVRSYLSYLPSRYGQVPCLTDAIDCIIARARFLVSPEPKWESLAISRYGIALKSLQSALDSDLLRSNPEVLCATEVLGLYELLNYSNKSAWSRHAAGGACLVYMRGPKAYTTEFEKYLFISQIGPIITESIIENRYCFLGEPEWQSVMKSLILKDPPAPERNEVVILLFSLMARLPSILKRATSIICSWRQHSASEISKVLAQAVAVRDSLYHWQSLYCSHLSLTEDVITREGCFGFMSVWYVCCIFANRIITALSWGDTDRVAVLEHESQLLAARILDLRRKAERLDSATVLFMAYKSQVAESIIATHEDWQPLIQQNNGYQEANTPELIERHKFKKWCALFGRKTT